MNSKHPQGRWIILALLLALFGAETVLAYHVGDVVDTDVLVDAVRSDALRSQMPLFGVGWTAHVRFEVTADTARTFSLQFEDGLWALPVAVLKKGEKQFLERMKVQFVYSKSGIGAIHAVVAKDIIYSPERRPFFTVEYQWVEEEAVYLSAGQAVMFLAVLVSSILFLLISCGIVGEDVVTEDSRRTAHSVSVPKWD